MDGRPQHFRRSRLEGLDVAWIEPQYVPDHQAHAALFDGRDDAPCGLALVGEGLFEQDGLAGFGRSNGCALVETIRQADADSIEVGQRQQLAEILEAPSA